MDKLRAEEQVSPEPTCPDDLTRITKMQNNKMVIKRNDRCWTEGRVNLRECADTLGRVSYVPNFDVSSGNSEDKAGSVPIITATNRKRK